MQHKLPGIICLMSLLILLTVDVSKASLVGSPIIDRTLVQESNEQSIVIPSYNSFKTKQIDALVKKYHKKYKFHGNVLVSKNGLPVYSGSVGYANFGTKEELDIHHAFQLASVSKQFTAMAIMILAESGWIKYDDEVSNYICEVNYPGMTIRHLLNHTSGVQNYMWLLENKWKNDWNPNNKEVLQFLAENQLPLNFKPGTRFSYSNTGYLLLASIVEKVSEMSYAAFVDRYILHPLEMHDTYVVGMDDIYRGKYIVNGYKPWRRGYYKIQPSVNDGCVGDKGIYASIVDLYKWDQALENYTLVSKSTMRKAMTKGSLKNRWRIPYGFGFRLRVKEGYRMVYHHGIWNGFRTSFVKNQDKHTTIIVLNHTNNKAKDRLVRQIQKIIDS